MAMRAQSLDRALPAIAGFIADRTGIPIIRGDRAMTDNQAIYFLHLKAKILMRTNLQVKQLKAVALLQLLMKKNLLQMIKLF